MKNGKTRKPENIQPKILSTHCSKPKPTKNNCTFYERRAKQKNISIKKQISYFKNLDKLQTKLIYV